MFHLVIASALIACTLGAVHHPRTLQKDGRIVGGNITDITKHPYQLSLQRGGQHACGAVIVSEKWALTVAFCTYGYSTEDISFRAGSSTHHSGGSIHNATLVVIHPMYKDDVNPDYDISLVKVSQPFEFNENIQPIDIGSVAPAPGELLIVIGWGSTEVESLSQDLMEVELKTIDNRICSKIYSMLGGLTDRMICASVSAGGKGPCVGDHGGATVANGKLVGLPSFGVGCGHKGYPNVFTNIAELRTWIYVVITEI